MGVNAVSLEQWTARAEERSKSTAFIYIYNVSSTNLYTLMTNLYTYMTFPEQTFGRTRTNLGCAAGRDLLLLLLYYSQA